MSNCVRACGPWNEGQGPRPNGEQWEYIDDPIAHVIETQGLHQHQGTVTKMTQEEAEKMGRMLGKQRARK